MVDQQLDFLQTMRTHSVLSWVSCPPAEAINRGTFSTMHMQMIEDIPDEHRAAVLFGYRGALRSAIIPYAYFSCPLMLVTAGMHVIYGNPQ